jgi:hypothetical protein
MCWFPDNNNSCVCVLLERKKGFPTAEDSDFFLACHRIPVDATKHFLFIRYDGYTGILLWKYFAVKAFAVKNLCL